jgi:hypothetical protein
MKKTIVKTLGILGAIASLLSGVEWLLSAQIQFDTGPQAGHALSAAEWLVFLTNQHNYLAAAFASFAGVAIGVAVAFDD